MSRQKFLQVETTATGAELDTLTDGSNAGSLHEHRGVWVNMPTPLNGWVAGTGNDVPQYKLDANGGVRFRGLVDGSSQTGGPVWTTFAEINPGVPFPVNINNLCGVTVGATYRTGWFRVNIFNMAYAAVGNGADSPDAVYLNAVAYQDTP